MVRTVVDLAAVGSVRPMSFLGADKRRIAWVEVCGAGEVAVHGRPSAMRELAAAANSAADQAEEMVRVAELLAQAGMAERPAA